MSRRALSRLLRTPRGANASEYAILVAIVGGAAILAILAAGRIQLDEYEGARDLVLVPAS